MGCCCPKEKNEPDVDERTRLLGGSTNSHERDAPKSRFLDQPGLASSSHHLMGAGPSGTNMGGAAGGMGAGGGHLNGNGYLNDSNLLNDSSLLNGAGGNHLNGGGMNGAGGSGGPGGPGAANSAANMQSNHMFEKILSEVIHVSAYDQRTSINSGYSNDLMGGSNMANPALQDMPFKLKEPQFDQQQQLTLPEGVTAPLTVLDAQPPFSSDIRLINMLAAEGSNCINNFSLNVPDNVAFDFKPVV